MMTRKNIFSKDERLAHRKLIGQLFNRGRYIKVFPSKVLYLDLTGQTGIFGKSPIKVLFTVPKKRIKSAVKRNRIKRLFREAYRKNRHILSDHLVQSGKQIILGFIYLDHREPNYAEFEEKIIQALLRLVEEI